MLFFIAVAELFSLRGGVFDLDLYWGVPMKISFYPVLEFFLQMIADCRKNWQKLFSKTQRLD